MSDVEKLTHENQDRRRWAELVDAREAAERAEKAEREHNIQKNQRERAVRRDAARACYMAVGASAAIAGAFIASGLARNAAPSWIGAIGFLAICVIFALRAVELDESV